MSPDRTKGVSGFMAAFRAATGALYDPAVRLYGDEVEVTLVDRFSAQIPLEPHEVYLSRIESRYPGEGHGSLALNWLTTLADDYEVAIVLTPEPVGERKNMSEDDLTAWYERHGFKDTGDRLMVYVPDALKGLYSLK